MSDVKFPGDDGEFLDREYNPRTAIPSFAKFFARWKDTSREVRASAPAQLGVRYGQVAPQTLDFFPAAGTGRPLLVFVHGGYWRALDKDDFSWLAPAYVAAGISVAILNYGLAPATPVAQIVQQVREACIWLHRNAKALSVDAARIVCAGHSAGAHLTAMMLATDWRALAPELPRRLLAGAVAISGLFDLEPLTRAQFLRDDLRLDQAQARMLSPAFLPLHNDVTLIRAVGSLESGEFHRQSILIGQHWPEVCQRALIDVPDCNHFSVCDAFVDPQSVLFQATRALLL
jgi:arylformamidase